MEIDYKKKGSVFDLVIFAVVGITVTLLFIFSFYVSSQVQDKFMLEAPKLQQSLGAEENATEIISGSIGQVQNSFNVFKWGSVFILVFLAFTMFVHVFLVRTHPVFFVTYILVMIIMVIVSVPISNMYGDIHENPILADTVQGGFFAVSWIFQFFPIWITVIGFIGGIILYANLGRDT